MLITIITLFPEMFSSVFDASILKRAQKNKSIEIRYVNLRDFGIGKHRIVDDKPYGGGVGMVLRADVLAKAIKSTRKYKNQEKVILLDPKGTTYSQTIAEDLSKLKHIILVCGRYEGFDERIRDFIDMEISLGDFVLSGGEIPAMAIIESVARLVPGVLEKEEATILESYSRNDNGRILEHPHYTRPRKFNGIEVPEVLVSGHKKNIEEYRKNEGLEQTKQRRKDLLKKN